MTNDLGPNTTISFKNGPLLLLAALLGLLFNYFFYEQVLGISWLLYSVAVFTSMFALAAVYKHRVPVVVYPLVVLATFFSAMVAVRASELLTFLNVVACLLLWLVIVVAYLNPPLRDYRLSMYLRLLPLPLRFLAPGLQTLREGMTLGVAGEQKKVLGRVLAGVLLSLPLLILFIVLFASADLIFAEYLSRLTAIDIDIELFSRTLIVVVLFLLMAGAFTLLYVRGPARILPESKVTFPVFGHIETTTILTIINLLFVTFIAIQITYFFSGKNSLALAGYTYAEYARRGFFELITVAAFSFLLVLFSERGIARAGEKTSALFMVLSSALTAQVLLIMTSAFMRLRLYELEYGFTTLRLYSHLFIIWLAVIFALLLYKIHINRSESLFAHLLLSSMAVFLIFVNLLNPEAFIAQQNIKHFAKTGRLDTYYLARLSADAVPTTLTLLQHPDEQIKGRAARDLFWYASDKYKTPAPWFSFHVAKSQAKKMIDPLLPELTKYQEYEFDTRFTPGTPEP